MSSASQSAPLGKGVYRFSVYELDARNGELRKFGTRIRLQQQPLQILTALVERPGEILTREELRQLLWPADTFVDFEHGLNSAIKKLRHALSDDPITPRFIETIPRRGYRFLVPVTHDNNTPPSTTGTLQIVARKHPPASRRFSWIVLVLTGVVLASVASYRLFPHRTAHIDSVAVLPLQNLSRDADQEYFADGLTDALITDLGKVDGIRVISRTSVMRYKGTLKPLPVIARELNVDAIVEGTVLRSGNHVRITTQLVRAEPETHLWAESYERDLSDVLQLQDELSRNIANHIQAKVGSGKQLAATSRPFNPEAYDAYLRGRYFFDKRVETATRKAISYFEEAIQKDPNYAPAYSGLADCYTVTWGTQDKAKGEAYARQALRLQDDLAEAHASLGVARLYVSDFRTADQELKRAIALNPNYSMAQHWYALYLLVTGRPAEALARNDIARQINPFSVPINNARIMILTSLRRYNEALTQAETLREIEDNYASHEHKARLYRLKQMYAEAMVEEARSAVLSGSKQRQIDQEEITRVYGQAGYAASVRKQLELRSSGYPGTYAACEVAASAAEAGNTDEAIRWLQRSYADKEFGSYPIKVSPEFDSLKSDPRFQEIARHFDPPNA